MRMSERCYQLLEWLRGLEAHAKMRNLARTRALQMRWHYSG